MLQENRALAELFVDTLKDVYSAEKQILKALPKLARAAQSDELRQAFETHREETLGQVERLEEVFGIVGRRAGGIFCEAMEGILEEGTEMMEEFKDSDVLDTALISSSQAVEHYEIARYTNLSRWARELDLDEAADLLDENLREEEATDRKLEGLAESEGKSIAKLPQRNGSAARSAGSSKTAASAAAGTSARQQATGSMTSSSSGGAKKDAETASTVQQSARSAATGSAGNATRTPGSQAPQGTGQAKRS